MFRLFDMLGRSSAVRALDEALRAAGVHPLVVPEPVKLTMIQLNKKRDDPSDDILNFSDAAELLAFCMLGYEQFADTNSAIAADQLDARFEAALEDGDTFDAKLILLVLHAELIAPEIADRIDLESP